MKPFPVGPYVAEEELGRGASGTVYRARDSRTGREVALKIVTPRSDPAWRSRFEREAKIGAELDHPGIVKVLEVLEHGDRPVLVMALVRGPSLRELMKAPIPHLVALEIAEKMARAVHHAHERGLVHRDLKPENILLAGSSGGQGAEPPSPVILDLGLAKHRDARTLTESGALLGTPLYLSPEQVRGEVRDLDARCDVWALGAMLHEMLGGRPPFAGEGLVRLLKAIVNDPPRPLPESAGRAGALALSALAKARDDRPASALAFAEACAGLRRELAPRSRSKLPLAATVVVAAGIVLLVGTLHGTDPGPPPVAPVPVPAKEPQRAPGPALPARLRASGDRFLWELPRDAGSVELVLVPHSSGPRRWIGRTEVTRARYAAFCKLTNREPPDDPPWSAPLPDEPAVNVSWEDATAFCRWAGLALPSVEEWDFAAFGLDGRKYPWGDAAPDAEHCVSADAGATRPLPVGARLSGASAVGALDMAGNVWEWCRDFAPDEPDRTVPNRVLRGGSFQEPARRDASDGDPERRRRPDVGFRVALSE